MWVWAYGRFCRWRRYEDAMVGTVCCRSEDMYDGWVDDVREEGG